MNLPDTTSMKPEVLAVIPARGGSKGLKRKNILPLSGRPLIAHSIKAALDSHSVTGFPLVSTDDPEIAEVAHEWGAHVPFIRPANLAADDTPTLPVLLHAIRWWEQNSIGKPDYVLLLQPTSPLRTAQDIDSAVQLAIDKAADVIVSVCTPRQHPYLAKSLDEDGRISHFFSDHEVYYHRRQDFPPAFVVNGAIYLAKRDVLLEQQTFYTERTYAYMMPPERSLDIDTSMDFLLAESILKLGCSSERN